MQKLMFNFELIYLFFNLFQILIEKQSKELQDLEDVLDNQVRYIIFVV